MNVIKEFVIAWQMRNTIPPQPIEVIYVFSGLEKHHLIGIAKDRLESGVAAWHKLKSHQSRPPVFLFQANHEWLPPVKAAFKQGRYRVDPACLRLVKQEPWRHTFDQFTTLPAQLKGATNWLLVTSRWHIPRCRRYATKHWPHRRVWFWAPLSSWREFIRHAPIEIVKILRYTHTGDL